MNDKVWKVSHAIISPLAPLIVCPFLCDLTWKGRDWQLIGYAQAKISFWKL